MVDDSRLNELLTAITDTKHGDPFRRITVLCGDVARRDIVAALARRGTWIGVDVKPLSAYIDERSHALVPRTRIRRAQILASVARILDSETTAFTASNTADQPATRRALSDVILKLFALPPRQWANIDAGENRPLVAEAARIAAAVAAQHPETFTWGEARELAYSTGDDGGRSEPIITAGIVGADKFDDAFLESTTTVSPVPGERFSLACAEEAEEVDTIAALVRADIAAGIPLDHIAVAYCTPVYLPLLRAKFAEAKIPFRAPSLLRQSDVPETRALLELVSIRADTMERRSLARLLATRQVRWKSAEGQSPTLRAFDRFTRGQKFVINTIADLDSLPVKTRTEPIAEWMDALRRDLQAVEAEATWAGRKVAITALANKHLGQVPNRDALDTIGAMDGIMPTPTRELTAEIMAGGLDGQVAESVEGESVAIGDLSSLAGRVVERAYVCGATAASVPGAVQEDPAIAFAQLGTSPEDITRRRSEVFAAATTAGERTVVSYPTSHLDGSGKAAPSLLLDGVPALPADVRLALPTPSASRVRVDFARRGGQLPGLDLARAAVAAREKFAHAEEPGAEFNGYVSAAIGARSLEREVSATQLEAYARNPLSYLLTYGLGAWTIEDPDPSASIDPRDRGVIFHSVFERWTRTVWLDADPRPANGDDIDWDEAERVLLDITDAELSRAQSGRYSPTAWTQFSNRVRDAVLEWFAAERSDANDGWVPMATELRFGGTSDDGRVRLPAVALSDDVGVSVSLRGDIDRLDLDTGTGRIRVTDYKSGHAKYVAEALSAGPTGTNDDKKLQLGLYAYLVSESLADGTIDPAVPRLAGADPTDGIDARYYFFLDSSAGAEDKSVRVHFGDLELGAFAEEVRGICRSICSGVFPPGAYVSGFRSGSPPELLRLGTATYTQLSKTAAGLGLFPLPLTRTEDEND